MIHRHVSFGPNFAKPSKQSNRTEPYLVNINLMIISINRWRWMSIMMYWIKPDKDSSG